MIGICLQACKKEAGEGGLASIKGKVYGYDINSYGVLVDSGVKSVFTVNTPLIANVLNPDGSEQNEVPFPPLALVCNGGG